MWLFQGRPDSVVRVRVEGVDVHSERPAEQHRVLWDDCQPRPQRVQADFRDVDVIDNDFPPCRLDDSEESESQARFTRTRAPNDANLLLTLHREIDALEDEFESLAVANLEVLELDDTFLRPGRVLHGNSERKKFLITLEAQSIKVSFSPSRQSSKEPPAWHPSTRRLEMKSKCQVSFTASFH